MNTRDNVTRLNALYGNRLPVRGGSAFTAPFSHLHDWRNYLSCDGFTIKTILAKENGYGVPEFV